jgi:hypothetical protein
MSRIAAVVLLAALGAASASSQTTGGGLDLLTRGERAYRAIEYDSAAAWLRRGLAAPGLPDSVRLRGLAYLGATELFRGRQDAAMAAFAEAVRTDRGFAPDSLIFPPRVSAAFEQARRATPILVATPPPVTEPIATLAPAPVPNVEERPRPALAGRTSPGERGWAFSGTVGVGWLRADSAAASAAWRGPIASGSARIALGAISLGVGLVEGRLSDPDGRTQRRDLVAGWARIAARPLPWLELSAGPEARALVSDSGSRRISSWRIAAGVQGPVTTGPISSYLDVWRSLAVGGDVAGSGRWQGGEAGIAIRVDAPLRLRIGYRVDDLVAGPRREILQAMTMILDLTRP